MSATQYQEPLALVIIGSISIGTAATVAAWITFDIASRRGWRSMMAIMIPVYIINALYLWPITMWTYLKYSRPEKPAAEGASRTKNCHDKDSSHVSSSGNLEACQNHQGHGSIGEDQIRDHHDHHTDVAQTDETNAHSHHHHGGDRPMFATVTIGVCHCGAGCVLGDIVGEWILYGTNAAIGSPPRLLWIEYPVDFAFAFAFGIIFQYFSIAPMTGHYGFRTVIRALQADALSLLFFELGLFGWMAIFQIAIFRWELEMNTVTYWFMMQIGMFLGHWTGVPINWWLISKGIKEPCA